MPQLQPKIIKATIKVRLSTPDSQSQTYCNPAKVELNFKLKQETICIYNYLSRMLGSFFVPLRYFLNVVFSLLFNASRRRSFLSVQAMPAVTDLRILSMCKTQRKIYAYLNIEKSCIPLMQATNCRVHRHRVTFLTDVGQGRRARLGSIRFWLNTFHCLQWQQHPVNQLQDAKHNMKHDVICMEWY